MVTLLRDRCGEIAKLGAVPILRPEGPLRLDIWEEDFQAKKGRAPILHALRPEGPWELSPGFSLGRLPPPRQPCMGVRPRRNEF